MKIEYNKKYLLDYSGNGNYTSQAVYLGEKKSKRFLQNTHVFMIWHEFMKSDDIPVVVKCRNFEIEKEDKLDLHYTSGRKKFAKISKLEREYLKDLAKKYWG
jgi:hypothetical protein